MTLSCSTLCNGTSFILGAGRGGTYHGMILLYQKKEQFWNSKPERHLICVDSLCYEWWSWIYVPIMLLVISTFEKVYGLSNFVRTNTYARSKKENSLFRKSILTIRSIIGLTWLKWQPLLYICVITMIIHR